MTATGHLLTQEFKSSLELMRTNMGNDRMDRVRQAGPGLRMWLGDITAVVVTGCELCPFL